MAYLHEHAPPGSMLALFAAAVPLYERFGFQLSTSGMFQYTPWSRVSKEQKEGA